MFFSYAINCSPFENKWYDLQNYNGLHGRIQSFSWDGGCRPHRSRCSGGSRISHGANPWFWAKTYYLARCLPKTAWKWKEIGSGVHASLAPLGSANGIGVGVGGRGVWVGGVRSLGSATRFDFDMKRSQRTSNCEEHSFLFVYFLGKMTKNRLAPNKSQAPTLLKNPGSATFSLVVWVLP